MSTIKFLQHVLGEEGHYCLFAAHSSENKRAQKFFTDVVDMEETAQYLDEQGYDVYFALATFENKGKRTAANAKELRSFFLDLDCGKEKFEAGKGYKSQQAAVSAIRLFCQSHQLPKPTIVNSGRGVHVYWALSEPLAAEQWVPLAERFKQMCLNADLFIDPAVPADSARVLRYPGTRNHKDSPPKAVSVLASLAPRVDLDNIVAILDHYCPEGTLKPKKHHVKRDAVMDALMGNNVSRFKTIMEKTQKKKGCQQLGVIVRNQATMEEPLWRAALSIAVNCTDADKAIHFVSSKHPEYDADETLRKANATAGPYHCETFNSLNPGGCEGCPHYGKITSPIQLGKEVLRAQGEDNVVFDKPEKMEMVELQAYTIPQYPWPYFRGKNGGVYIETEGNDGERVEQLLYENDLYVVRRVVDPEEGDAVVLRLHLPHDGIREFTVPLTAATSREELRKYMSRYGVAVSNMEHIMQYTLKWVQKLAQEQAADVSRKQFGWVGDDYDCFVLGRMLIYKDRVEINPPSVRTAPLFHMFEPKGSMDTWKSAMDFFGQPGMEAYQYMIGCSFGSVLTRMTAISGSMFHFHSEGSGKGKTTALFAAASIWAAPGKYVKYERDTTHDKMLYAEILKDLPLLMDELTNMKPQDASDLIYQIPSGQQRGRMVSGGNQSRWRGEPWKLISASTGNASLLAKVAVIKDAPKAEFQRVIECSRTEDAGVDKSVTDALAIAVNENYGHAGLMYVQFIMNNIAHVKATLGKVQKTIDERIGLAAPNRFWSAQAACVITGLMIAKKLQLIKYDIKNLTNWVVDYLSEYKQDDFTTYRTEPQEVVAEYFYDNVNNFLRIRSTDDLRGGSGLDHLVVPEATPRINLLGRLETDTNKLYLLPKPFKHWCANKQIDFNWVMKELKKEPCEARSLSKRLTKGTKMNMPPVNVIEINGVSWLGHDDEAEIESDKAEQIGEE